MFCEKKRESRPLLICINTPLTPVSYFLNKFFQKIIDLVAAFSDEVNVEHVIF